MVQKGKPEIFAVLYIFLVGSRPDPACEPGFCRFRFLMAGF